MVKIIHTSDWHYESDKYDETNTGASFTRGEKIKKRQTGHSDRVTFFAFFERDYSHFKVMTVRSSLLPEL